MGPDLAMTRSEIDAVVRAADPVSAADVEAWSRSGRPGEIYRSVVTDDPAAATRTRTSWPAPRICDA